MAKGNGGIFHPKFPPAGMSYAKAKVAALLRESPTWWLQYYVNGRKVRESAHTEKKTEALRQLALRTGAAAKGEPIAPKLDRVTYDQGRADLLAYYATSGERQVAEAARRLKHLDDYFSGRRLASIGADDSTGYAAARRAAGAANGTINREMNVLGRMLSLAVENKKLWGKPLLRKLKEADPRAGFFERHQYEGVLKRLPEDLQCVCTVYHTYGWRKMEVLNLQRRHLDLAAGTLALDPGTTKNGEGRTIYLTPELKTLLAAQVARVEALQRRLGRIIPWLFPHLVGAKVQSKGSRHIAVLGEPIRDFRRMWRRACKDAGCPGMLRHDFRRTAVRNMEQAGVPRSVAMQITGHKTETVYRRYAIVSKKDMERARDLLVQASK